MEWGEERQLAVGEQLKRARDFSDYVLVQQLMSDNEILDFLTLSSAVYPSSITLRIISQHR